MSTISHYIKAAKLSATYRGHDTRRFVHGWITLHSRVAFSECKGCGAGVEVVSRPYRIGGVGLEVSCNGRASK